MDRIRTGFFGTARGLELADFNAAATNTLVANFNKTPVSGWYSAGLTTTGTKDINLGGLTQLRLRFGTATNGNGKADFMRFVSGNNTSLQPQLVIVYLLPPPSIRP